MFTHLPSIHPRQVCTAKDAGVEGDQLLLLSIYLGAGFVAGCVALGYLTVRTSAECFICRRHLVQTAAVAGGGLTLLLVLARDASAYSLYAWAYGAMAGAYYLGLKLYTLELVHQQLMERAWSFMSAVQCFPFLFGAPVASECCCCCCSCCSCSCFVLFFDDDDDDGDDVFPFLFGTAVASECCC